jgi:hypothetical protein
VSLELLKNKNEKAPCRKLFLSVEGLMIDLLPKNLAKSGDPKVMTQAINQADLDTGLFYFGCTRDEFFGFKHGGIIADQIKFWDEKGLGNFRKIETAVLEAENDGRVFWPEYRDPKSGFSYKDLNSLLKRNKIDTPLRADEEFTGAADFEKEIRDQIEKLGLPLDVIG